MLCGSVHDQSSNGNWFFAAVCTLVMAAAGGAASAPNALKNLPDWEGRRANSILLNGDWEFSLGDGSERAESADGANRLHWKTVTLPGPFMPYSQEAANQTKVIWACRSFKVTPAQVDGMAVLSQRFVRAISPATVSEALKQREFVILGSDPAAQSFFKSHSLLTSPNPGVLVPGRHVAVIWDASCLSPEEKRQAKVLDGFLRAGGRVIVLSTPSWDWPELCDVKINHDPQFSRVFPYESSKNPLLEGIDPAWLIRWNGLPGAVARGTLEGEVMTQAEKILWAREPKTVVMAMVPAASGGGRIVFSQLDLKSRVDRSKPNYDPVAERVLLNLLGRE